MYLLSTYGTNIPHNKGEYWAIFQSVSIPEAHGGYTALESFSVFIMDQSNVTPQHQL